MAGTADVIASLPELRFRGLRAPCDLAPLDGAHDQAEFRTPYRDAAGHDHMGRAPYRIEARLYFMETIEIGSFPDNLQAWIKALEDGSLGPLLHPIRGPLTARVLTWRIDLSAAARGGVIITVVWTETVKDFATAGQLSTLDIDPNAVAAAADEDWGATGLDYPDGVGSSSFSDMVAQVEGAVFSLSLTVGGLINKHTTVLGSIIDDLESLNDHDIWAEQDKVLQLWARMRDAQAEADKQQPKPTKALVTTTDSTLDKIAGQVGNTTEEVMGLNLHLLSSPRVPSGSRVLYYANT